jgi:phosphoribosylanthranilate isomerase
MAEVKICGIKDAPALDAALAGGARFIGLVFFAKSPRNLDLAAAARLAEHARAKGGGQADTVAVTVDADDDLLARIAAEVRPDWIQAHGAETPRRTAELRRFAAKGVIKALALSGPGDLAQAGDFSPAADMLLFDAKAPPGADRPGGNALAFDWNILAGQRFSRPWLLSGGLSQENVAQAIRLSGAGLVDVSSGVESAPGLKHPGRIAAFLAAARTGIDLAGQDRAPD